MPLTKNVFVKGKMNKDLDERLVPNGEYRDALNVQISTSDGSDIGAMQNILGNELAYTNALGITGGRCIGSIADNENNKIYWFIKGNNENIIAEYNDETKEVLPVLVDDQNVLKFDKSKLITGINVLDGFLLFTDNNSEPKCIDIEQFKSGTSNFSSRTQLKDFSDATYDFTEEDITVIKKGPKVAPSLTMRNTSRVKGYDLTALRVRASVNINLYTGSPAALREVGDTITIEQYGIDGWRIDDIISLEAEDEGEVFGARVKITNIGTGSYGQTTFTTTIVSISDNIPTGTYTYDAALEEKDPLFEKDFVRFAYRYKYTNNQYSIISPFSEIAFLPGEFEYNSSQGYNLGMNNTLRFLRVSNFINQSTLSKQVKEIELLFKKENNTNIYSVKSFKYTDKAWGQDFFEINTELIYKVLPANQLLRPYDNIPKKAKAQEIVANRLIYGNYLQNFDLTNDKGEDVDVQFENVLDSRGFFNSDLVGTAQKSIKSLRTYQMGVTYLDEYGRETPVQTNGSGTFTIPKASSSNSTRIKAKLTNTPPKFAKGFKFYIKQTSNQYYNLAQSKWYYAEDGNVWLAFASSERNKVDEETFIILKKQHDGSNLVSESAKYKIISIENNPPQELKLKYSSYGLFENNFKDNDEVIPTEDATFLAIKQTKFESRFGANSEILSSSNLVLRMFSPEAGYSRYYDVTNISLTSGGIYRINIDKAFKTEINRYEEGDAGLAIEFAEKKFEDSSEFSGKFFVKIKRDAALEANVLSINQSSSYVISESVSFGKYFRGGCKDQITDDWEKGLRFHISHCGIEEWKGSSQGTKPNLISNTYHSWYKTNPIQKGRSQIAFRYISGRGLDAIKSADNNKLASFTEKIVQRGTKIRFKQDPTDTIYEIRDSAYRPFRQYDISGRSDGDWNYNQQTHFVLQLDKPIQGWDHNDISSGNTFDVEILEARFEAQEADLENPAIWETEPKEAVDLNIYYEASNVFDIAYHNNSLSLNWFNCFSFGNGVESDRIRDDFNAPIIQKGVRASAPLDEVYKEERRKNGLIFSGIFNSRNGINRLNQFIAAENITKDLNPEYGSIQKLHTRDTDLVTFCEDKVLKVLAQKDALFNADGNANVTSNAAVLGQAIPFVGEFGISKNPESFQSYGYRMFFSDRARGAVLRLSRDGIETISTKGMTGYFYEKLKESNVILGTYDNRKGNYNLTLTKELDGNVLQSIDTISFKQEADGWVSRKSFIPESGVSLNSVYYTFKNGEMYSHISATRNTFYGTAYKSSVKLILNSNPSEIKNFKTVAYEGNKGWSCVSILTDQQNGKVPTFIEEEGKYYNFIKGIENTWDDITQKGELDTKEFSTQGIDILSSISGDLETSVIITIKENKD